MQEVQTVGETGLKDKCKSLREWVSMDASSKVSWILYQLTTITSKTLHIRASIPCPAITHHEIRRWPGFFWHYTELPSAKSLISAQNRCYFNSPNKARTTVYNTRHCNEQQRKSATNPVKVSSWQSQLVLK